MFNFIKKAKETVIETKEKAEQTLEETKDKVAKLTESADKFISDGNNQMKVITIVAIIVGASVVLSNVVTMATSIYNAKHNNKQIVNNIYINKIKEVNDGR